VVNFGQILTAMVTPFDQDGEIDIRETKNLVNYLIANGTDGLVVAGTTGESATLSTDEKIELFKLVVEAAAGRVPVIAGTGTNSTKATIELTKQAEACGVDGIMLVNPYYNKPSQEGLYQHYKAGAEATKLPVMLYNIPGRTAVNMTPETIIRLSEVNNIVCVKEASADLDAMTQIISGTPDDFTLYSGDDGLTLPILAIGGIGVVSVASHILGNDMQKMISLFKKGQLQEAAVLNGHLRPIMRAMFAQPSPSPVKAALNLKGLNVGGVRLPMLPLTEEELNGLRKILQINLEDAS